MTQVLVYPDLTALCRKAADHFMELAIRYARQSHQFSVVLAGGTTPRSFYTLLANDPYRSRIPWREIHFFWGDERWVSRDHPESNSRMADEVFLSQVPIPAENIHPIVVEQDDPVLSAEAYERTLQEFFKLKQGEAPSFDLVLLGLGEDGHTASLFPDSPVLTETDRLAAVARGTGSDRARVTLTLPVFNKAKNILWLVSGAKKKSIVQKIFSKNIKRRCLPAEMIQPKSGEVLWLMDQAAAKEPHDSRG